MQFAPSAEGLAPYLDFKDAVEQLFGRPIDLVERGAIETSRNSPPRYPKEGRDGLWLSCRTAMQRCSLICCLQRGTHVSSGGTRPHLISREPPASERNYSLLGSDRGGSRQSIACRPKRAFRNSVAEHYGMRHRLVHGYNEVRLDVVWSVVRDDLGPLIAVLERLVPGEDEG